MNQKILTFFMIMLPAFSCILMAQKPSSTDTVRHIYKISSPITVTSIKPDSVKGNNFFKSQVTPNLISLSLISPTLYNNWETQLKIFKKRYKNQNVLLAVSKTDSEQKAMFVTEFTRLRSKGKALMVAYSEALKVVTVKYTLLDFKHHLYLKKK